MVTLMDITTITTTSGSTYYIIGGDTITRVSDSVMVGPDGEARYDLIEAEDFTAIGPIEVGRPLAGLVGEAREPIRTSPITSITYD